MLLLIGLAIVIHRNCGKLNEGMVKPDSVDNFVINLLYELYCPHYSSSEFSSIKCSGITLTVFILLPATSMISTG
ncbi:MAG: hypothetical protein ACI8SC_002655 [Colwellia sp.]|jgi:hypothetical protein